MWSTKAVGSTKDGTLKWAMVAWRWILRIPEMSSTYTLSLVWVQKPIQAFLPPFQLQRCIHSISTRSDPCQTLDSVCMQIFEVHTCVQWSRRHLQHLGIFLSHSPIGKVSPVTMDYAGVSLPNQKPAILAAHLSCPRQKCWEDNDCVSSPFRPKSHFLGTVCRFGVLFFWPILSWPNLLLPKLTT